MLKKLFSKFTKGDRKYFSLLFFLLVVLLISAFTFPSIENERKKNWENLQLEKTLNIEKEVRDIFKEKGNTLLSELKEIKASIVEVLRPDNSGFGKLIDVVNRDKYDHLSIELVAPNGKIIAWNQHVAVPQDDIFPLNAPLGEIYFYDSNLMTYLSVIDTIDLDSENFYVIVSNPIQKKYHLNNPYYKEVSLTDELSEKFYTEFEINYRPFAKKDKDGRKYSFELMNNVDKKMGVVSFYKPSLVTELNNLSEKFANIQTLIIIAGAFALGFGIRREYKQLKSPFLKAVMFIAYFGGLRILFFVLSFPSKFITGSLTESALFSSKFAGGMVKSPIEFFITAFFILLIVLNLRKKSQFKFLRKATDNLPLSILLSSILLFIFMMIIRGLSAAIKSVIFDSTIRYFKDPSLIPNLPVMVMVFNILVLGVILILLLFYIFDVIYILHKNFVSRNGIMFTVWFYIITNLGGFLFIAVQKEPLITYLLSFVIITFLFIAYLLTNKKGGQQIFGYVYITIASSMITIMLLNYFNVQLEKNSLQTTAAEINRTDDNLIRFLLIQTLDEVGKNKDFINSFKDNRANFNSLAFLIWSKSPLQKESLNSYIAIFNKNFQPLGEFSLDLEERVSLVSLLDSTELNSVKFFETKELDSKKISVVKPLYLNNDKVGYIYISSENGFNKIFNSNYPKFLEVDKNVMPVDYRHLLIFEVEEGKLTQIYGEVYPTKHQLDSINSTAKTIENEGWMNLSINDEKYFTYLLKNQSNENKILAISYKEKQLTWNLFNFFKIFIIHVLYISVFIIIIFFIKVRRISYSFRTKLLLSFLIISIIPVIILAVYNRQVVSEKTDNSISSELRERIAYIENHLNLQLFKKNRTLEEAFINAGKELNISFDVYENSEKMYSSREDYFSAGLFDTRLNPDAYYLLNYLTYKEYLLKQSIDNYSFNCLYKKINIRGKDYIISVNDAFNRIELPLTGADVDVFLFGVYSLAAIIIIIISTLLANRMSSPIKRLTMATDSVAHGDLNVQIEHSEKGEIKELFDGFNYMTKELKKNEIELAELERENAWKEMARQVAHEIKNPLTPMKLAMQQLVISYKDKNPKFDQLFDKVSQTVLNQIENLSLIATEFSNFARMPKYHLEKLDLVYTLADTVNLFIEEKIKIIFNNNFDSANIEADKSQIRRLIINMIRNSIQAESTKIEITLTEDEKQYVVMFKDNGKGIPEDLKEKIFEINFTTKKEGSGIGLKLGKRFMQSLKGDILLTESDKTGTEFKLLFPKTL